MATTIVGAWQVRGTQHVAPETDTSATDSPSKTEVEATLDAEIVLGYFGHLPPEGS